MKITKRVVADSEVTLDDEFRDDPDEVSLLGIARKREDDRKAKEAAEARARRIAELREKYSDVFEEREGETARDRVERLFEQFVPDRGPAELVIGELIRALSKIGYRWYNDGDIYFMGYGIETAGDAAKYLCDMVPGFEDEAENFIDNLRYGAPEDDEYEQHLNTLFEMVLDYIDDNLDVVLEPNTDDMFNHDGTELWSELEPKDDVEIEIPYDVQRFYELGLNSSEVVSAMNEWVHDDLNFRQADIAAEGPGWRDADAVTFSDVPVSMVEDLVDFFSEGMWESYVQELIEEYGDPDEVDEDEDDGYDEYDDEDGEEDEVDE